MLPSPDDAEQIGSPQEDSSIWDDTDSQRRISHTLSTKLHPDLLRGVPLHVALAGWGRYWANSETGMFSLDSGSYDLSRSTERLDAFFSHDWASSSRLKVLTLVIMYNSRPAFWACLLVSILIGVLRGSGALIDERWTVIFGHGIFLLVLVFWQRFRRLFKRPRQVFLDKLCVAQYDAGLKMQGILGMPAFLLNSHDLVVLLTPQYFRRLWCTFELATFMKEPAKRKRIRFMPLKTTAILVLVSGCWFALLIGWSTIEGILLTREGRARIRDLARPRSGLVITGLMLSLASAVLPLVFYLGLEMIADMEVALQKLQTFSIQDADCFCCSNDHRHPHTGEELMCDRFLVYSMLNEWYGGMQADGSCENDADNVHLKQFDHLVREDLAPRIAELVGGFTLPVNYTLYMVGVSSVPHLADYIALWIATVRSGLTGYALCVWTLRQMSKWGTLALASMLSARVAMPMWKVGLRWRWNDSACCRWCIAFILSALVFLFVCAIWAPMHFFLGLTEGDDPSPLILFLFWLAVALVLYCQRSWSGLLRILGIKPHRSLELSQPQETADDETFSI